MSESLNDLFPLMYSKVVDLLNKQKMIIYIFLVFIIGVFVGLIVNINKDKKIDDNNNYEEIVSGYSFEMTDKNVINKDYDGTYLKSFVTVAEAQDEFTINLNGINSDSEVMMIDPNNGDMKPMNYENGVYTLKANLDNDVTYGIIIDFKLSGSIRVVNDLNSVDKDKLFNEILIALGCGL